MRFTSSSLDPNICHAGWQAKIVRPIETPFCNEIATIRMAAPCGPAAERWDGSCGLAVNALSA
jgi:hypothetical protein